MLRAFTQLLFTTVTAVGVAAAASAATQPAWLPDEFMKACERNLDPTSISLEVINPPVRYRYDRSINDLTQISSHDLGGMERVLGLTEFHYTLQGNVRGRSLVDRRTGLVCSRPNIRIVMESSPQVVSVAREFPRGSCSYDAILEHEHKHVQINANALEYVAQASKKGLINYFGQRIYYGQNEEISDQITHILEHEWFPWIHSQMQRTSHLHDQVDSPQERMRIRHICGGEMQLRLNQS